MTYREALRENARRFALRAIEHVLDDPSTSYWLKDALRTALQRDCVDALNDAESLVYLLKGVCP
jgi:hypothetical protein